MGNAHKPFFTDKGTFLPAKMATAVGANVRVGPDGGFWSYQTKPSVIDDRTGVWIPDPEVVDRRVANILRDWYLTSRGAVVERLVRHDSFTKRLTAESPEKFDPWINCHNMMLNWRDTVGVQTEPHHPDHKSMIQLNVAYDPKATCPAFDAWLAEVLPDEVQELAWEVLGYMLMSGNPLQRAFLLLGPEGTGKSTFLRVITHMLGRVNISAESLRSLTENRFAAANLFGKAANIVGDIDASYMNDTSLFLQITGSDTMSAEFKGKTAFPFEPHAVPMFSTNKVWQSANTSGAYFRRWVILPFDHQVDRSKPFDEQALFDEAPGILNKALRALRELYYRTENVQRIDFTEYEKPNREFTVTGAAREARERFARDSDPIREWLAEDELVQDDVGNELLKVSRTTVYARYSQWCTHNGIRKPKSGPEFYKALRQLGFPEYKSNGARGFTGLYVYVPGEVLT